LFSTFFGHKLLYQIPECYEKDNQIKQNVTVHGTLKLENRKYLLLQNSVGSCYIKGLNNYLVESMKAIYMALFYGIRTQPLEQLIDTYDTS